MSCTHPNLTLKKGGFIAKMGGPKEFVVDHAPSAIIVIVHDKPKKAWGAISVIDEDALAQTIYQVMRQIFYIDARVDVEIIWITDSLDDEQREKIVEITSESIRHMSNWPRSTTQCVGRVSNGIFSLH